jgi:hypothetical protein
VKSTRTSCFTSPPYANQRAYTTGGIADWDRLMQGVFAVAMAVMAARRRCW